MKKYIMGICVAVLGLILASCNDKLDVAPPNQISDEQIQEILNSGNEAKIQLVMSAIASGLESNFELAGNYSGFGSNPLNPLTNQDLFGNLRANDIVLGERTLGPSGTYQIFYEIDPSFEPWLASDRTNNYTWWWLSITPHTNANKVLAYLGSDVIAQSGSKSLKDYRARCLTVRAYGYNMLMERYQKAYLQGGKEGKGMPIYTVYALSTPPVAPSSATATYDFIKKDLQEAVKLFGEAALGEKADGFTVGTTNDIDRGVAQFLLARVSLWTGDYATCIASCQDILAHYPTLISKAAYGVQNTRAAAIGAGTDDVFAADNAFSSLKKNPECILGWVDGNGAQTYQYSNFNCFAEGVGGLGQYYMRIDNRLYEKIADNDLRKGIFLTEPVVYTYPTDQKPFTIPVYTNLKWGASICLQQTKRTTNINTDYSYYRSSEALLMLAEAQASSGQDAAAKTTLNTLLSARTKAGAATLTCDNYPSMQGLSALAMVKLQWRIEMWGENGDEFYNNKRWNVPTDRNGSAIHWSLGKTYSVAHMTYEIPIQETSTNGHWNE